MRRTLMILSLLFVSASFIGCGERSTTISNANAQSNATGTTTGVTNQGATAGTGPQNQGIGGNTNEGVVNGNTYTVPPGFNKNGDRGSASSVNGNTP
jgi:hypothetical protein